MLGKERHGVKNKQPQSRNHHGDPQSPPWESPWESPWEHMGAHGSTWKHYGSTMEALWEEHRTPALREVLVVNFTFCGDFCGDFHYKLKSPQVLVAVFTIGLNHHKFLW